MPTITIKRKKSMKGMFEKWKVYFDGSLVNQQLKNNSEISFTANPGFHEIYVEDSLKKGSDILEFGADTDQHFIFEVRPGSMFTLIDPRISVKLELKEVREATQYNQ